MLYVYYCHLEFYKNVYYFNVYFIKYKVRNSILNFHYFCILANYKEHNFLNFENVTSIFLI